MDIEKIYLMTGFYLWITFSVLTIIAIGRYAFHCALHEYPCPSKCKVFWGITLAGENRAGWLETAFFSVLIYIVGGFFGIFVYPLGILFLIHKIIETSRKKRFGH